MGALSGAYYGVGYHIIQSGFYYIPRLSGYIGRMDLYIHFLISTDLYRSYLSESFLALSKVFAEKTLSNLHILTFSSNDACPGNTNGNGICILFLLAGILRTCLLFLHTYSDGLYILDLDSLKDKNLFYIEVVNNELGRTLEKIKNILNKNAEVRRLVTKDAITQALVDTIIEGGLNIDAIHLEIILSHQCKSYESNLIEPEWQYRNATYRMITLNEALKDNKSITISLMYKDINKLLFYPLSFMKSDPSVMDLFYMTKPQMYMSMEPVESNLVDDKEVEGPIRPFVFAEPPVMSDDED